MVIAQVDERILAGAHASARLVRAPSMDDDMLIAQVDEGAVNAAISARRDDAFGAAIPMLEQSTRGPPLPPGFHEAGGLPMVVDSSFDNALFRAPDLTPFAPGRPEPRPAAARRETTQTPPELQQRPLPPPRSPLPQNQQRQRRLPPPPLPPPQPTAAAPWPPSPPQQLFGAGDGQPAGFSTGHGGALPTMSAEAMQRAKAWLYGDDSGSSSRNGGGGGGSSSTRGACSTAAGQWVAISTPRRAIQSRTGTADFVIRTTAEAAAEAAAEATAEAAPPRRPSGTGGFKRPRQQEPLPPPRQHRLPPTQQPMLQHPRPWVPQQQVRPPPLPMQMPPVPPPQRRPLPPQQQMPPPPPLPPPQQMRPPAPAPAQQAQRPPLRSQHQVAPPPPVCPQTSTPLPAPPAPPAPPAGASPRVAPAEERPCAPPPPAPPAAPQRSPQPQVPPGFPTGAAFDWVEPGAHAAGGRRCAEASFCRPVCGPAAGGVESAAQTVGSNGEGGKRGTCMVASPATSKVRATWS